MKSIQDSHHTYTWNQAGLVCERLIAQAHWPERRRGPNHPRQPPASCPLRSLRRRAAGPGSHPSPFTPQEVARPVEGSVEEEEEARLNATEAPPQRLRRKRAVRGQTSKLESDSGYPARPPRPLPPSRGPAQRARPATGCPAFPPSSRKPRARPRPRRGPARPPPPPRPAPPRPAPPAPRAPSRSSQVGPAGGVSALSGSHPGAALASPPSRPSPGRRCGAAPGRRPAGGSPPLL
ncbi:basic proline-rich protein-like [Piliocolobus tephrosceles]|uniref:basic proline-rich protein-like n=1 Tax=Piliocolobus tephrosceles TaxID=591936 RepID=UPI000C2A104E|nr:basic proline-rich protein-like [Piliocolobus tephrosceles]